VAINTLLRISIGPSSTTINNNSSLNTIKQNCCVVEYTLGTVHDGLSGSSSLPISGIVGLLLEITTDVDGASDQVGNPPYLWNRGWFSVSNGDGLIEEKRLTRQNQIWLPAHMSMTDRLGWWLPDGLVVKATELLPVP
jgi:hypothetical protein